MALWVSRRLRGSVETESSSSLSFPVENNASPEACCIIDSSISRRPRGSIARDAELLGWSKEVLVVGDLLVLDSFVAELVVGGALIVTLKRGCLAVEDCVVRSPVEALGPTGARPSGPITGVS